MGAHTPALYELEALSRIPRQFLNSFPLSLRNLSCVKGVESSIMIIPGGKFTEILDRERPINDVKVHVC